MVIRSFLKYSCHSIEGIMRIFLMDHRLVSLRSHYSSSSVWHSKSQLKGTSWHFWKKEASRYRSHGRQTAFPKSSVNPCSGFKNTVNGLIQTHHTHTGYSPLTDGFDRYSINSAWQSQTHLIILLLGFLQWLVHLSFGTFNRFGQTITQHICTAYKVHANHAWYMYVLFYYRTTNNYWWTNHYWCANHHSCRTLWVNHCWQLKNSYLVFSTLS